MADGKPPNGPMDVKTAGRTVDMFEIFARTKAPMTLSEIARALGAPQSSCFNLIRSLEARGYLYSVGGAKRLYPTRKLYEIVGAIADYDPVIPRIEPSLAQLRDATGETVIFGTRQGNRVVYLAVAEGNQTIRYISHPGELKPLHSSAIGKALLMQMPETERTKLISRLTLDRVTDATLTSPDQLLRDLALSERRGYAITSGENVADVMALACPLVIESVTYGVAIAGPINRLIDGQERYATQLRQILDRF